MKRIALLIAGLTALAACGTEPTTTAATARAIAAAAEPTATKRLGAGVEQDLARLRAATAGFHRYDAAKGQYTFLFMNMCMTGATGANVGGMGYHWVNTSLLDSHVDVETPEALLYEPEADGRQRLVAVEYVIPKALWHEAEAPTLFGQTFKLNKFDLWALHVWVWKDNPDGLFADWNPLVTCENATPQSATAH
jgi:hypothetical protein